MIYTQNISLDVAREQTLYINAKQYDSNSRFLEVTILAQGQPQAVAAGSAVTINARRPDGSAQSFAGTVVGGLVRVPVDSWILEQYGTVYCSISVVDSNTAKITTLSFRLIVERSEGNGWILVYTAPAALSAGTYYITLSGINYQFTTTQTVPLGGKIYFSSTYATGKTVGTSDIETLTLTVGSSGTQLVGSDVINFLASFMGQIAELGNKADKAGESPDLVAGTAEQIIGEEFTENKVPYSFRQTPGSGKRLAEEVVGATVAWNQLVQDGNFPDDTKWLATGTGAVLSVANNKATMHRDSATSVTINLALGTSYRPQSVSGHKYLFAATIEAASGQINFIPTGSTTDGQMGYLTLAAKTRVGYIWSCSVDKPIQGTVRGYTGLGVTSAIDYTVENYICIDLTAALGSTIADYLYTLESGTPGAGVAKFRELFPADYYAYCEPTLQSVCVSEHREYGVNAWDEEWEVGAFDASGNEIASTTQIRSKNYTPTIQGATYFFHIARTASALRISQVLWFDSNKAFLERTSLASNNATATVPSSASYFRFQTSTVYGTVYLNDICINLSNPLINGKYFPYSVNSYPLEAVELRGVFRLDSNNNIYADGDTYEGDGTVTRRYGSVDLGTMNWGGDSYGRFTSVGIQNLVKRPPDNNTLIETKSVIFQSSTSNQAASSSNDKVVGISSNGVVQIRDSDYSDAATFKTAMSGVYLVYELNTPTTESAAPYPSLQHCSGGGTEEYVDYLVGQGTRDVSIPAGHNSKYYPDLTQRISDIPEPPSGDGTYTLKCTVSSGVRTFAWV